MFDIGFSELVVIMLVALIVIGPERLPKVARSLGQKWGRLQRYVNNIKTEVSNDLAFQEARKMHGELDNQVAELGKTIEYPDITPAQQQLQELHKSLKSSPGQDGAPRKPDDPV